MPNIPDFSIEVGLFGVQVLCYGALTFYPRNEYAMKIDTEKEPPFFDVSPTHKAATWLLAPQAPEVIPPEEIQIRWKKFKENAFGE